MAINYLAIVLQTNYIFEINDFPWHCFVLVTFLAADFSRRKRTVFFYIKDAFSLHFDQQLVGSVGNTTGWLVSHGMWPRFAEYPIHVAYVETKIFNDFIVECKIYIYI